MDRSIAPPWSVPANASRFFATPDEAINQPLAQIQPAWNPDDPYLVNAAFNPRLVQHDDSYCTSVVDIDQVVQVPTLNYFDDRVAPHLPASATVCDIGCGQGELVQGLRNRGYQAVGFDPVLRQPAAHLHRRYWTADDPNGAADLYVMRCVLPHIPHPWTFLDQLGKSHPGSLALIEFQRLEWILDLGVWHQLNHDHVNQLSTSDLAVRFDVVAEGTFSNDEWAWVLIRPDTYRPAPPRAWPHQARFDALLTGRDAWLAAAPTRGPLVLWGAAGKGIVLAHALQTAGADVIGVVDADPARQGLHIEATGHRVDLPDDAPHLFARNPHVVVANPNHMPSIEAWVDGRWAVSTPSDPVGLGRP